MSLAPTENEIAEKESHDIEKHAIGSLYLNSQTFGKTNPEHLVTSFDLEKVLNTPHGKSILFFYARKYAVYNLTFYESTTRNVFCFIWGESDGKRGCNEICSIMYRYLSEVDARKTVRQLSLFCDNCAGQQKNLSMLSMIAKFMETSRNVNDVSLNFLMSGHSVMTADSVHAVIERATSKKTVYAPSEWLTLIANCRYEPCPYNVIKLTYKDFDDWKSVADSMNFNILEPKSKLKISHIRTAHFDKKMGKNRQFEVFYSAVAPQQKYIVQMKQKRNHAIKEANPKYCKELPINTKKYNDLVKLCTQFAIPQRYHDEYLLLSHSNTVTVIFE